jgi:predicted lipid carrier protein YhbT
MLTAPAVVAFRPELGELRGTGQTLHFHATDEPAGEWLVRRDPDRVTVEPGHGRADVAVRGPARDLLLVLYGRLPPDTAEVLGDADVFAHWLKRATL